MIHLMNFYPNKYFSKFANNILGNFNNKKIFIKSILSDNEVNSFMNNFRVI